MKNKKTSKTCLQQKLLCLVLIISMTFSSLLLSMDGILLAEAAHTTITSMDYYSAADGPVITGSGVDSASYGFVMPIFNGGSASWEDIAGDLTVNVMVNGEWVNIDDGTNFIYNQNWGHWHDSGFSGYWFMVSETTQIQLASISNDVTLNYTFEFTNIETATISSMAVTQGPELVADATGSIGFTYPIFNGDSAIPYEAVAEDLKVYVKTLDNSQWIDIDDNAASGWIYDQNFGQFWDGPGGYWFVVDESINVKLEAISSGVNVIYTINYSEPIRNSHILTSYDGITNYVADEVGAIGLPLPKIDGGAAINKELDAFVYEVKVNGQWVELSDYSKSGFSYSGNGYNNFSDVNQWGYWVDYIYGLWFQPIQEDMELRIGYPLNGVKGDEIGNNYVNYTFIGNPDAPRPDMSDLGNIELGSPDNPELDGYSLVFNDEFEGTSIDTSVWNYETGYYLNDDPGTWGWGNNELQWYSDSERNTFVEDGKLCLRAFEEAKSFPQDPSRYAQYSSGKVTTKDKFSFNYGRIDFRAKLPKGNGLWPALWMMPNDDSYGTWAASGEIDVMEARGRLPGASSGALHYGGTWPANTYTGGDYSFPDGQTIDSDFHVYSVVWEEDNIKWYVDGECFLRVTSDQWYSTSAPNNPLAPFDKEFYIIMNLAVGGWFDGGITPGPGDIPATMQVDYVRVYKEEGSSDIEQVPVTGISLDQTEVELTSIGQTTTLTRTITPSNATNRNVVWETSNPLVATVSAGQVRAVGNGTAVITATTRDGGFKSSCLVTVNISEDPVDPVDPVDPTEPVDFVVGNETYGLKRTNDDVEFYVNEAAFADLHYRINSGEQINVGMNSAGNETYRYLVSNLKQGDIIEYFFTYNPGNGALDTEWLTYIHGVTQGDEHPDPVDPKDPVQPEEPVDPVDPTEPVDFVVGNETYGLKRTNDDVEFYVNEAAFADLHYRINSGGQINVGMNSAGNKTYRYLVSNLKQGDIIEYSFTYNPGNGALDTEWLTYIHGVTMPDEYQGPGENSDIPGTYENIAEGKNVTASASENAYLAPANLTDKDLSTRWSSNWVDDVWFIVDFGRVFNINQIVLNWENAFGRQFELLISQDGVNFERVFSQTNGTGGIETINIEAIDARYVKFQGIQRALPYGYSLYQIEVYGVTR